MEQWTEPFAPAPDSLTWWRGLPAEWQRAFNEAILGKGATEGIPADEEIAAIRTASALRFAGPRAPFPNMSFELRSLTGLQSLPQLETLVVIFHQLQEVQPLRAIPTLRSLFLYNNQISSLTGLESLVKLEQLYINVNRVRSLAPLAGLTRLRTLYVNYNDLRSLEGITPRHANQLREFFCLPNEQLPQREIIRVENQLGIRCRQG